MAHLQNETDIVYDSLEMLKHATQNTPYEAAAKELLAKLPPHSQIVDLGCGFGETSIVLALAGHTVHSVEPALNRSKALAKSLNNLGLTGHVHVCTAEDLDKIPIKNLDGALFFSSLHHCDDPLNALKKTKCALGSKGVIVVVEPILRFYRTKKWYDQQLSKNPVKMGNYGGNEHIYYFKEYYNMLKEAGFSRVDFEWAGRKVDIRKVLIRDLGSKINGSSQHTILRCLIKYLVFSAVQKMCANKFLNKLLIKPLVKISLIQASFIAFV